MKLKDMLSDIESVASKHGHNLFATQRKSHAVTSRCPSVEEIQKSHENLPKLQDSKTRNNQVSKRYLTQTKRTVTNPTPLEQSSPKLLPSTHIKSPQLNPIFQYSREKSPNHHEASLQAPAFKITSIPQSQYGNIAALRQTQDLEVQNNKAKLLFFNSSIPSKNKYEKKIGSNLPVHTTSSPYSKLNEELQQNYSYQLKNQIQGNAQSIYDLLDNERKLNKTHEITNNAHFDKRNTGQSDSQEKLLTEFMIQNQKQKRQKIMNLKQESKRNKSYIKEIELRDRLSVERDKTSKINKKLEQLQLQKENLRGMNQFYTSARNFKETEKQLFLKDSQLFLEYQDIDRVKNLERRQPHLKSFKP